MRGGARPGGGRKPGMPRVPGSGRPKGTPNKNTAELRAIVKEKLGKDALEELCERYLYHKEKLNEPNADTMLKEIASYVLPKLKAIEHTGKDGESLLPATPLTTEQLAELARKVRAAK